MGNTASYLADIEKEYGSWENYLAATGFRKREKEEAQKTYDSAKNDFEKMDLLSFVKKYRVENRLFDSYGDDKINNLLSGKLEDNGNNH
jgi:hypothetical protein